MCGGGRAVSGGSRCSESAPASRLDRRVPAQQAVSSRLILHCRASVFPIWSSTASQYCLTDHTRYQPLALAEQYSVRTEQYLLYRGTTLVKVLYVSGILKSRLSSPSHSALTHHETGPQISNQTQTPTHGTSPSTKGAASQGDLTIVLYPPVGIPSGEEPRENRRRTPVSLASLKSHNSRNLIFISSRFSRTPRFEGTADLSFYCVLVGPPRVEGDPTVWAWKSHGRGAGGRNDEIQMSDE